MESGSGMPPTLGDVRAYVRARGYTHVDANRFYDNYSRAGWKTKAGTYIGGSWKQYVDKWEREDSMRKHDKPDAKLDERFARFAAIESEVIESWDTSGTANEKSAPRFTPTNALRCTPTIPLYNDFASAILGTYEAEGAAVSAYYTECEKAGWAFDWREEAAKRFPRKGQD